MNWVLNILSILAGCLRNVLVFRQMNIECSIKLYYVNGWAKLSPSIYYLIKAVSPEYIYPE
jgi:hypothetical protein